MGRPPGRAGGAIDGDDAPGSGHAPVLLGPAVEALAIRADGTYVDATFGRGGHSRAILERLGPDGRLIALDRDPAAVAVGAQVGDARLTVVHSRFSQLAEVLDEQQVSQVDGVFFDLGVSSPQFDEADRGFSFRFDGPLDMRMDPTVGIPAWQWLNQADEKEIREVIKRYGEDRLAGPIAKAIVARRADATRPALKTTKQLATLVAGVVRRRSTRAPVGKNEATRTFQAIRIFLNQELEELTLVLSVAVDKLAVNGRLVVISFHSLEDRIVKEFVAVESGRRAARDPIYGQPVHESPVRLQDLGRVLPADEETAVNPRARSAVMRVAQRLGDGRCVA